MSKFQKLINPIEVIRAFVKANLIKEEISINEDRNTLVKKFEGVCAKIDDLDMNQLYDLMPREIWRFDDYQIHSWVYKPIELKYLAPWYKTGDLPAEWCALSVTDVAMRIKQNPDKHLESVLRIKAIERNIELVTKYFPLIAYQGGEVREGKKEQALPIDSEDGSHRSIAAALSGKAELMAFVGFVRL